MATPKIITPVTPAPAVAPRPRKGKRDPQVAAANRALAQAMVGYDSTSIIWKKTVPELLDFLDEANQNGVANIPQADGSVVAASSASIIAEWRKRVTQNKIAYS